MGNFEIVVSSRSLCESRLKMKKNLVSIAAQRSLAPELWDVSLEKSQSSSHEVASIICRRRGIRKHPQRCAHLFRLPFLPVLAVCVSPAVPSSSSRRRV